MNSRQRVCLAIEHCEADRVPTGEITIADGIVRACLQVNSVAFPERVEFVKRLGVDAICESPQWPTLATEPPNSAEARWKDLEAWARETDHFVFVMLDGVFGWGIRLMGFEGFMAAFVRRSQGFIDLIEGVERLNITLAKQAAEAGADGILVADDIAYKQGTTVSPKALREFFFPSLARQLDRMASLKIPVFFHSDGNLSVVIEDLVELGFQGLQCLESDAGMDLAALKATYGERICLWGNLDPQDLFLEVKPEELERKVTQIIDVAAPGGGFIFGSSSGLVEGMRPENIETVYHTVRP